ncbi:MAG: GAF domain-containing protein [Candidatus Bipolaricaulota bacterium]
MARISMVAMGVRPAHKGGKGTADLAQLLGFLRELNRGSTLAEVGEAVLRYAIALVPDARTGTLLVLDDAIGMFEFRAAVGWDIEQLARIKIPKDKILQKVVCGDRPSIVRRPRELSRQHLGPEIAAQLKALGPCAAFLTLPIVVEGKVLGYLNLDNHENPDAFSEEDFARLELAWEEITLTVQAARGRDLLLASESRYRELFEESPISLWEEDFSEVKRYLDGLREQGVVDLRSYLEQHPEAVWDCVGRLRVRHVNKATLRLYKVTSAEDLLENLGRVITPEVHELFKEELLAIWEAKREFTGEGINYDLAGDRLHILLRWAVLPGSERLDRVLVSILDITARVEAEEALARRDQVLSAVSFAAERFLRGEGFAEAVAAALARLGEAAGVSRVYIFENRTDEQGRILTSQRYEWVAPGIAPQIGNPDLQDLPYVEAGFARWVESLSRGEVVHGLVRGFPETERPVLEAQGIVSIAVVPIFVVGAWWGFIGFDDCAVGQRWLAGEIAALRAAAQAIGAAIERTRIEEELRARQAELEGLYEVSVVLGATLDLDELFRQMHEEVSRLIPCDAFTIALVDARRGEFHLEFAVEEGAQLPKLVRPLDPSTSLTAWIVSVKEPLLICDFEGERDRLPAAVQRVGKEVASWLGVPLILGDEVLGVISVQSFRPRTYDEGHLRLLSTIAGPVATAIRNAQAYAALAELERKLRAVEQASQRMKLADDKETLYAIVLKLADEVLGYRACAVLEHQGDALVLAAERGYVGKAKGFALPLSGASISVDAFSLGEPIYVLDVSQEPVAQTGSHGGSRSRARTPPLAEHPRAGFGRCSLPDERTRLSL